MTNEQLKGWLEYQIGFAKRMKSKQKSGSVDTYWNGQIDAFEYALEKIASMDGVENE